MKILESSGALALVVQKHLGLNCVLFLTCSRAVPIIEVVFSDCKLRRIAIDGEASDEEIVALVASALPRPVYERLLVEDLAKRLT